ncbi:MAG: DUF2497 domain-containing protein [Parvibaculales bacterium]
MSTLAKKDNKNMKEVMSDIRQIVGNHGNSDAVAPAMDEQDGEVLELSERQIVEETPKGKQKVESSASSDSLEKAIANMQIPEEKLEKKMEELLTPLLTSWIENHLCELVERIMRERVEQYTNQKDL